MARLLAKAAPVILPPLAAMVKSFGSINQVPVLPFAAVVLIVAVFATLTLAAEVSIKPPLPFLGAEASSLPATFNVPLSMLANTLIVPAVPLVKACALTTAPFLMVVCWVFCLSPSVTTPPPALPDAVTSAPLLI